MIKKQPRITSPKILKAKEGAPCMRCDKMAHDACHLQGMRAHSFGKAMGKKSHDFMVAFLCRQCHIEMDNHIAESSKMVHSEEFLFLIAKTWMYLIEEGVIEV